MSLFCSLERCLAMAWRPAAPRKLRPSPACLPAARTLLAPPSACVWACSPLVSVPRASCATGFRATATARAGRGCSITPSPRMRMLKTYKTSCKASPSGTIIDLDARQVHGVLEYGSEDEFVRLVQRVGRRRGRRPRQGARSGSAGRRSTARQNGYARTVTRTRGGSELHRELESLHPIAHAPSPCG